MKKLISVVVSLVLCTVSSLLTFADSGEQMYIYSTDILTFINGQPIAGYNIGGKTVVIAEELEGYGFDVEYDDLDRTLKVVSCFNSGYGEKHPIQRGILGKIEGTIYKTDIKTYYNGIPIEGYNIGGRTAICIEDLGDTTDSPNVAYGYSQYLGRAFWDSENRIVSYQSYMDNKNDILGVSGVYHSFTDNVIYTYADDKLKESTFSDTYTYSPGTGMSRYILKPLYLNSGDELVEIGLCVANPNADYPEALMYITNPAKVRNLIENFKISQSNNN